MPTTNTPSSPSRKGTAPRRPVRALLALVATVLALLVATPTVATAGAAASSGAGVVTYPGSGGAALRTPGRVTGVIAGPKCYDRGGQLVHYRS